MLRARTDADHRAVDGAVEAGRFFDSIEAYTRFLECTYRIQAAVESALDAAGAPRVLGDWARRRRAAALLSDLATLAPERRPVPLPRPDLRGPGEIWGALYVVEGSTLGGRSLLPRIAALGPDALRGTSYLESHGADTGPMWRRFIGALEAAPFSLEDMSAMVRAATRVFGLYRSEYATCRNWQREAPVAVEPVPVGIRRDGGGGDGGRE